MTVYQPDFSDKMKYFFQAVALLLYECTAWTLTEKKLDGNYTRMLSAVLNKFWKQQPTKHQLPISKNIQVRQAR